MMKKSVLALILISTIQAQAQQQDTNPLTPPVGTILQAILTAIKQFHTYVGSAVDASFEMKKKLMFEKNPSQDATVVGNAQLSDAANRTQSTVTYVNNYTVVGSLQNRGLKEVERLGMNILASDTPFIDNPQDMMMNAQTLLSPIAYTNYNTKDLTQNPSYNFIQLAGQINQPITDVPLILSTDAYNKLTSGFSAKARDAKEKLKQINYTVLENDKATSIQTSPDYQKLQAAVRGYVASQSIGVSNLYKIMIERIPQPGLGLRAGVVDDQGKPVNDASPLQVQQYLATRRSQNKDWYNQMAQASPATVQRETLYVLAEIREQLFQMQQQNERLIATLSVMQMQQNFQNTKIGITPLEQSINSRIKGEKGEDQQTIPTLPDSGVTPITTTP